MFVGCIYNEIQLLKAYSRLSLTVSRYTVRNNVELASETGQEVIISSIGLRYFRCL